MGGNTPPSMGAGPSRAPGVGVQPGAAGVVRARQVIIVGSGGELLVYSPTAAAGNLIASIAGADFTDAYGNAGLAGITSYTNSGAFYSAVAMFDGVLTWYEAATGAGPWTLEASVSFGFTAGVGGFLTIGSTAGELQLAFNGGVIPQASAGITTVPQVVAALIAAGIFK